MPHKYLDKAGNILTVVDSPDGFTLEHPDAVKRVEIDHKEFKQHVENAKKNAVYGDPDKEKLNKLLAEHENLKAEVAKMKADKPAK